MRLTATISEPAPVGGSALNVRISADWYPTPIRVLVPAGERSVSYEWTPPTGFKPFRDYQVSVTGDDSTARASFRATGLTDAAGYAVTAFDAPPTLVAGRSYPATTTINRPAPAGGLLVDRQTYGSYQPQIGVWQSPVLIPAGSRKARITLTAPTEDITAPRRSLLGLGLGFWAVPAGGPTYQKLDINPMIVPKWFSITYSGAITVGTSTTHAVGLGENPNPDGTYVSLESDNPAVVVPARVYVPPGSSGAEYEVSVKPDPTSRAARITARWSGLLSTSDITILGTSLPDPAPTPTPTPFPDWRTPRATLTSGPTGEVSGPVTFGFESDEPGSTFLCSLSSNDGFTLADRRPCSSPKTYSGLEPGGYRFKAQAVDPTGNVDPVGASRRFTIVGAARPLPTAPAFTLPTTLPLPTTTVRGTAESGARIEIVDRWAWNAPLWPATYWTGVTSPDSDWEIEVDALAEGGHWLSARAINRTGAGPWSAARMTTVDTGGTPVTPTPTPSPSPTPTPDPVDWFKLTFAHSGMALSVAEGTNASGAAIVQWPYKAGDFRSQWKFVPVAGSDFEIVNRLSGMCLDIWAADSSPLLQWPCAGVNGQRWYYDTAASRDGYKVIKNRESARVLNQAGHSTAVGADVIHWYETPGASNEQLAITPIDASEDVPIPTPTPTPAPATSQYNTLTFVHSLQALSVIDGVNTPGAAIIQRPLTTNRPSSQWELAPRGSRGFEIVNRQTGQCLDIWSENPGPLLQWPCDGGLGQRWEYDAASRVNYKVIRNVLSGYVINQNGRLSAWGGSVMHYPEVSWATNERLLVDPVEPAPRRTSSPAD